MRTSTRHEQAAGRAVGWLTDQLGEDGSFGPDADDVACYYKSPYLLALSGRPREAGRLLDHIQRRFMRGDGDFTTTGDRKSEITAFLLEIQDTSGAWSRAEPTHTTFDQTAEIAIWLQEIAVELDRARTT
jgi:hypothetical protein